MPFLLDLACCIALQRFSLFRGKRFKLPWIHCYFSRMSDIWKPSSSYLSCMEFSRYIFVCRLPGSGDGEIRTLDPLLARQVLSQLSYAPIISWRPPAFPRRLQRSIIGLPRLNHRVRNGHGCFPRAHRHQLLSAAFSFPDSSTVKQPLLAFP